MRVYLLILLLSTIVLGCGKQQNTTLNKKVENKLEAVAAIPVNGTDLIENEPEVRSPEMGDLVEIKFNEFVVEIDSLYIWQEEEFLTVQQDTAEVYLELGEMIEGQTLKIKQLKKGNLRVYQQFENSITIMAEGPHCDLTEWKHYNSKWKELKIADGEFLTKSYSDKDRELFEKVSMNELREVVKEQCGDEWAAQIKDIKSPTEYPAGVGTSRIFLRFVLENGEKPVEKVISFVIPMGC